MTPRGDFSRHEPKKTKKTLKKVAAPTEFMPPPEVQVVPKGKKARPPEEEVV
ncbi:MAG: hypothetical protein HYY01_13530 [Chloroflexi bacterium]|nr:hypothetical protein [Chloroflexota bacterium]